MLLQSLPHELDPAEGVALKKFAIECVDLAPASMNSATGGERLERVLEWRNQPVSIAIAVSKASATSGVYEPRNAEIAFMIRMPVASAVESLKTRAPKSSSLTWWSMTTRGQETVG